MNEALKRRYVVNPIRCTGCGACLKAGCRALTLFSGDYGEQKVEIAPSLCDGCGVCLELCSASAITCPVRREAGKPND